MKKFISAGFQILSVLLLAVFLFPGCPQPHDSDSDESPLQAPAASVILGDGKLSVGWAAESGVGYRVFYGTVDNPEGLPQYGGIVSPGSVIAGVEISGLANDTLYNVWIRAEANGEQTGFSPKSSGKPEAPPAVIPPDFSYVPGGIVMGSEKYAMYVTVPTDPPGYYNAGQTLEKKGVFVERRNVSPDSFFMAKYQTTQKLWYDIQSWAEGNGYSFQNRMSGPPVAANEDKPVAGISWRDAIVWCNAYSEESGLEPVYYYGAAILRDSGDTNGAACDGAVMDKNKNGYRLPTEVEREYAARGGDPGKADWMFIFAGSNNADEVAWHHSNSAYQTKDVGQKNANRLGIYDLSGNVQEWGWDWMNYAIAAAPNTPWDGEPYGGYFVQKPMAGGGVGSNPTMSCVADRWGYTTNYADPFVGFRVVRKVE